MKIKVMFAGLLLSGVVLVASQTAHAEDSENTVGKAKVEVIAGSDALQATAIKPYPPTGPMLSVGELGISSATPLYFDPISLGDEMISREALYVYKNGKPISNVIPEDGAEATVPTNGTAYAPGFSVIDRRGTGAGWVLTLSLGEFTQTDVSSDSTPHKLKGVSLSFPLVTVYTSRDASDSNAPDLHQTTVYAGGADAILMDAPKDAGMGIWAARYNSRVLNDSVNDAHTEKQPIVLSVPSNNYAGTYEATLIWKLNDTPLPTL